MTDTEILKKAIEKAVEGGYDLIKDFGILQPTSATQSPLEMAHGISAISLNFGIFLGKGRLSGWIDFERIIFSHSFAKAFWGEGKVIDGYEKVAEPHTLNVFYDRTIFKIAWQYHLQQLVLSEDRLKYIGRFLDD